MDLFTPIVPEVKLHQKFLKLKNNFLYSPAKKLIEQIAKDFHDKDGNLVEQFQTGGFNARIWELYLNQFFLEQGFKIEGVYDRPDYDLSKNNYQFFVEASSSYPTDLNEKFTDEFVNDSLENQDLKIQDEILDHYVIKLAGVLYSKLKKEYWKLPWVASKPLLLAIKPSHHKLADFIPDSKIISYLYGMKTDTFIDESGNIKGLHTPIQEHVHGKKIIPSGFFTLPDTENISGVIFSNAGNLDKFNRMGLQQGLGEQNIKILRNGTCYDPTPGAMARKFNYWVGDGSNSETWNEGISIFHNPNAKFPLDRTLFKGTRQVWITDGKYDGEMTDFFPFHSMTAVIHIPE